MTLYMYLASSLLSLATYVLIYPPKFAHIIADDDLHEVYHELVSIKARYYQLGIALGLPPGELEAIQQAHSHNVAQALTQVLLIWLRQRYNFEKFGRPIWQKLREAVDSPSGGENPALAEKIAEKHLASYEASFKSLLFSLSLSLSSSSPASLLFSDSITMMHIIKCTSGVHYCYR